MKAAEILRHMAESGEQIIEPGASCLQYEGRIDFSKEGGPLWVYPATSVRIRFRGSRLEAVVTNYRAYWDNYLGYILDGEQHCVKLEESGITRICLYDEREQSAGGSGERRGGSRNPSEEGRETPGSLAEQAALSGHLKEGTAASGSLAGQAAVSGRLKEGTAASGGLAEQAVISGDLTEGEAVTGVLNENVRDSDETVHEVLLFKRQDSCHMVQIHGFIGSSDTELLPCTPLSPRRIEVYGDSVSAGEVSEAVDYCGQPDPVHNGEYSNSYYSYAWLTARKLGARLHDIAQGGIALMDGSGYFMEPEQRGMESIFDKVQYQPQLLNQFPKELGGDVPCGSEGKCLGKDAEMPLQWDFSLYRPQVVIVAVGQNDAHPDNFCGEDYEGERAACWRKRYADFLRRLRKIHPQAHIICMTTILNHDENWDRAIEEACAGLGDSRVHHFLFSNNGRGTHGHIRRPEAEKMAEELSAYIEGLGENIWRETGRLEDVFARAEQGEDITIGFLGGSITQGSLDSRPDTCYASLVYRWWQERFPKGNFSCVNAGIGGTTSHFGAARADEDLLYARPDVVFVEFSVNDDDNAHFRECYEGLIRHILRCDWKPAVVLLHNRFYSDGHSAQRIHDEVGRYYGLPRVCMGDAVLPRIQSGELDRDEITPDGLHPNDRGHELLAEIIRSELEKMYRGFRERNCTEEKMPVPFTYNRYENTRRFRNDNIRPVSCSGFTPDQTPQAAITETFRRGWTAEHAGDEICFDTECRCIAVQYRRTVSGPAPKALAFVDGDLEHGVILDGNFDEDWGDCLELQVLLEAQATGQHRVTIRITEAEAVDMPFYLVSLILA